MKTVIMKEKITKSGREAIGFLLAHLCFKKSVKRDHILSIYFHNPCPDLFKRMIQWLHAKDYRFISADELYDILVNKKSSSGKLAIITFDDGWNKNLNLLDYIRQNKVPITLFVPTEPVIEGNFWWEYARVPGQEKVTGISNSGEFKKLSYKEFAEKISLLKSKYRLSRTCLNLEELKAISKHEFITIGSHTVTHPILDKCSKEVQEYELTESKKLLEEWLGKKIKYLSYPNGDFNDISIDIARRAGYKLCFTTEYDEIDIHATDPFKVPRYSINDRGGYYENLAKTLGVWQKIFKPK
jgi:peptidoglycan/xylan/chitin deacetylase (PgdA/CDA1 family)